MIPRMIRLPFGKNSFFLFGPRQVGKSTLVTSALSDLHHITINLLKTDVLLKYKTNPELFRSEIEFRAGKGKKSLIFIDEIQKAPDLLNEIHYLIEKYKDLVFFVMTGSSARKLRRSSVNMLAGRAWEFRLFPFTHIELCEMFCLDDVLLRGSLPSIINMEIQDAFRMLRSYSNIYLKEEILDEALVRNISAFSRFLELAADQSGRIVNFTTISREIGVKSNTIKGYYQIMEDTLVALKLEPYLKSARKRLVRRPKYFLFDTGVINSIAGRTGPSSLQSSTIYGILFEHFIILETHRLLTYMDQPFRLYHWRSSHGAEVDLVVERGEVLLAVEIKSTRFVRARDLRGLRSFMEDYPNARPVCVSSTAEMPYAASDFPVMPWKDFFGPDWLAIRS